MCDLNTLLDSFATLVADKLSERMPQQATYYTVPQLAERYGLSQDAVRKRIRAGEFGETLNIGDACHRVTPAGITYFEQHHTGPAYNGGQAQVVRRRTKAHADSGRI